MKPKTMTKEEFTELVHTVGDSLPKGYGFMLMVFPSEDIKKHDQQLRYSANCDRKTTVAVMKEWLIQRGFDEDWMRDKD